MASRRNRTNNPGLELGVDVLLMAAAFIGSLTVTKAIMSRPGSGAGSMSPLPSAAGPGPAQSIPAKLPPPTPQPLPVSVTTPEYTSPPVASQPQSSGPQTLTKRQPIDMTGQRVLLMGDSLGVGVGPLLEKEFRALGISAFKNISVGGKNIAQFSDNSKAEGRSFEKAMVEFKPTIVFISLGTNDEAIRRIKGGDPRYFTAANLAKNLVGPNFSVAKQRRKAIARLAGKLSGVKSIFIGPPASDPTLWPMDREFRNLLASTWQGSYFNTEAVAPQKSGDKIHLTGSGNKSWASDIARWVRGG